MKIEFDFLLEKNKFKKKYTGNLNFEKIIILSGKNGVGKSTFLKCIAGFESAVVGYLKINNIYFLKTTAKIKIPPHQRNIGYCFQEPVLLPNLTVEKNIFFSLKSENILIEPLKLIYKFKLANLLGKFPEELSGGEKQKISFLRTIFRKNNLILMDEPFSSLDEESKYHFASFTKQISEKYNIPIIFVTHNKEEIKLLSNYTITLDSFDENVLNISENNNYARSLYEFQRDAYKL